MSQTRVQRFDRNFLRDFRHPIAVNTAVVEEQLPEAPPPPPPPSFSEADLEQARMAAKKLGYAEGFEAGLAQANTENSQRQRDVAQAIVQMRDQVRTLAGQYQRLIDQQSAELGELVMMIARKVAGEALDANAPIAFAGLLQHCVGVLYGKPRVVIELAPAMHEIAAPVLRDQLSISGFEGDLQFRVNDALPAHDMRIDWGHGEATRSTAALWHEIEALLQQVPLTPTLPPPLTEENHHG